MKIRTSYVSNSSSSSYVFAGRQVDYGYAKSKLGKELIYVKGIDLVDSHDFFKLEEEYLRWLEKTGVLYYVIEGDIVACSYEFEGIKKNIYTLPDRKASKKTQRIYYAWSDRESCTYEFEVKQRYSSKRRREKIVAPLAMGENNYRFICGNFLERFEFEALVYNGCDGYVFLDNFNNLAIYDRSNSSFSALGTIVKVDATTYNELMGFSKELQFDCHAPCFFSSDSVFLKNGEELTCNLPNTKVYYTDGFEVFVDWSSFISAWKSCLIE